jgi:carbon storage regulator
MQEAIEIDGGITIRVVAIRGNTVRLGIEAPQQVGVKRSELPTRAPQRKQSRPICAA